MAIEGLYGEPLPLAVPLPLGRRPAPQWLHALEGALSYSLACRLTECLATFPEELMGTNPGDQGAVNLVLNFPKCYWILQQLAAS